MVHPGGLAGRVLLLSSVLAVSVLGANIMANRTMEFPVPGIRNFPQQILGWYGVDRSISNEVLSKLGVDDFLMREYSWDDSRFWLYIGYYRSQKGSKTVHSPKHCYPGSGWQKVESSIVSFPVEDGKESVKTIPVNRYLVAKGGDQELVYYWYQTGNTVEANEYFSLLGRVRNALFRNRTDGALVRLSTRFRAGHDTEGEKMREAIPRVYHALCQTMSR